MRWMAWLSVVALLAACGDDDTDTTVTDMAVDAEPGSDSGPPDLGEPDLGRDAFEPGCTEGCEIVDISAGGDFSCAQRANGEVLCWGGNLVGQLGDGAMRHGAACGMTGVEPRDCSADPVVVSRVSSTALDSEGAGTCAIDTSGDLFCWGLADTIDEGSGNRRRLFTPETRDGFSMVDAFAKGGAHTCALLDDGSLICAGQNESGQVGNGDFEDAVAPDTVALAGVLEVGAGSDFACARTATEVRCWGDNLGGQLGDDTGHSTCGTDPNTYDCSSDPTLVSFADATMVEQIALGADHACALMTGGTLQCWGFNGAGQTGQTPGPDVRTPTEVDGLTDVTLVAAGRDNTCVIVTGGDVKCFGSNSEGQLGDGEDVGTHTSCDSVRGENIDCSATPVDVALPEAATDLAIGSQHACAIGTSGTVYCWGWNDQRQLGPNGSPTRQRATTPVEVSGFE